MALSRLSFRARHGVILAACVAASALAPVSVALAAGGVVLGAASANPYSESVGLGAAHPALIYLGAGPSSEFTGVHWRSWGAASSRASARGTCTAKGRSHSCGVTLVAQNLGPCHGVTAYRTLVVTQGGHSRRYSICPR